MRDHNVFVSHRGTNGWGTRGIWGLEIITLSCECCAKEGCRSWMSGRPLKSVSKTTKLHWTIRKTSDSYIIYISKYTLIWYIYIYDSYISQIIIWFMVDLPLWKIWVRQLGLWLFPIHGKIIQMSQTTNQRKTSGFLSFDGI